MTTPALSPVRCGKCGAEVVGRFCADCGSAVKVKRDLSVKHFLREAVAAVTDVDSALIASFRDLILRPGALTASYLAGERYRYLAPFRVFLLCNVLYFLVATRVDIAALNAPFAMQVDGIVYKPVTRRAVNRRLHLDAIAVTPAERATRDSVKHDFEVKYDGATEGVAKAIVVILIPFYALIVQVLFIGSGRYFAEHLVFATHFVSFFIVALLAAVYALQGIYLMLYYSLGYRLPAGDNALAAVVSLFLGGYAIFAFRRVYGGGWVATFFRAAVIVAMFVPALLGFKFILFFATLYWMS